jgi:hypothetical protein
MYKRTEPKPVPEQKPVQKKDQKGGVTTPHPVARPWWFRLFDIIRR